LQLQELDVVVLVAGGIGITAVLGFLDALTRLALPSLKDVRVMWAVRDQPLIDEIRPLLDELIEHQPGGRTVKCDIHQTRARPPRPSARDVAAREAAYSPREEMNAGLVMNASPLMEEDVALTLGPKSMQPSKIRVVNSRPDITGTLQSMTKDNAGVRVGLFSCGPAPLLDSCREAAVSTNTLYHEETFAI